MANPSNLKSFGSGKFTPEEEQEIRRKGNEAYKRNCQRRKALKEQLELILQLPVESENIKKDLKKLGIKTKDMNNEMLVSVALWKKAVNGDVNAFNSLRDTIGEKPLDKVEVKEVQSEWFK